jgi:cation transport ATPase
LAAGVLYPFFGLLLSLMIAGAAMGMNSVSVIGNALRLRKMKLWNVELNRETNDCINCRNYRSSH